MCVIKKNYINIITGQKNSFSKWVHSTIIAVSIVGNINIRVQSSDPNFRPATSDFNKGTSNVLSYVEILLCEVNSFSGKCVCIENYIKNKSMEFHSC